MALTDTDRARFMLYAGRMLELEEVLAEAESPADLRRHIEEWEQSRRRGDDDGSVTAPQEGPGPRPLSGGAEADDDAP